MTLKVTDKQYGRLS